jgi:hypothetical protein
MFYDPESIYLNLQNIYTHKDEDWKHVEGFDILPPNFDFSFGSIHFKDFLKVKNTFIDTHYEDIIEISEIKINNKLVTHTCYNRAGMNHFLKNLLTDNMHSNIVYNAVKYSKLDLNMFISIKDVQHLINKIYIRYYYVYIHHMMPLGKVRMFNSKEARIDNYNNRMTLVLENFHEITIMDWKLNNPNNMIFIESHNKLLD